MMLGVSLGIAISSLRFSIPSSVNAITPSSPTPTTHSWPSSVSISSATSNSHSSSSPSIPATWLRVNTWLTAPSSRLRRKALLLRSLPVPGQQLIEPVGGVGGDASEYIGEPGLRVDVVYLGRDDEAIHGGGSAP